MAFAAGLLVTLLCIAPLVLLIVFISRVNAMENRLRRLEQELARLRSTPAVPAVPPSAAAAQPVTAPPVRPPISQPLPPVPQPVTVSRRPPSRFQGEWEAFVGGKLMNRIGALALFIGVGFFLKYAVDNDWINERTRVLLGAAAGIALLFLGARFHRKGMGVFGQGLIGSGIAILYLTVYASFNYYHLVPQLAAMLLMSVVTAAALYGAVRYEALAISILGWAGGYLTPFMLTTGVANEVGLFSYIALLEGGLLSVVLLKSRWRVLELLTLAGSYAVFTAWCAEYYEEELLVMTVLFLALFWFLLHLADLLRTLAGTGSHVLHRITRVANAGVFGVYFIVMVDARHHGIMSLLTLLLAAFYALPVLLAFRRGDGAALVRDYTWTAIVLVTIATAIQFSGFVTVAVWACEALILIWSARRWQYGEGAQGALLFFLVIVGKLIFTAGAFGYVPIGEFSVVLNWRCAAFVIVAASMLASAWLLGGVNLRERDMLRSLLSYASFFLLFWLVTTETFDFFRARMLGAAPVQLEGMAFTRNMVLLCMWTVTALPLVYVGSRRTLRPALMAGCLLTALIFASALVWGAAFRPVEEFRLLWNVRMFACVCVLGGSLATARWLGQARSTQTIAGTFYPVLLVGQILLLLIVLSGEIRDLFEQQIVVLERLAGASAVAGELRSLENMKQLSLSGLWLVYGIALMTAGIWRHARGARLIALGILAIAILKIFVYDLSFLQTLYRIFSFIGLGLILLATSYMYGRYKTLIFGSGTTGKSQEGSNAGP